MAWRRRLLLSTENNGVNSTLGSFALVTKILTSWHSLSCIRIDNNSLPFLRLAIVPTEREQAANRVYIWPRKPFYKCLIADEANHCWFCMRQAIYHRFLFYLMQMATGVDNKKNNFRREKESGRCSIPLGQRASIQIFYYSVYIYDLHQENFRKISQV